jgi:hypothetical protein
MKVRKDADGHTSAPKGSWAVGITIDALQMAEKLDAIVLMTGDGDFVPLVDTLKAKGCRVEIVSFDGSTSGELIKAADQFIPIHESWIFKEKKFDTAGDSTAAAPVVYAGLPNEDELDMESQALEDAVESVIDVAADGKSSSFGILE